MSIIDDIKGMDDTTIALQAGSLGGQVDLLYRAQRLTAAQQRYAHDLIDAARDRARTVEAIADTVTEGDWLDTIYGEAEVVLAWTNIVDGVRMIKLGLMERTPAGDSEIVIAMTDLEGVLA